MGWASTPTTRAGSSACSPASTARRRGGASAWRAAGASSGRTADASGSSPPREAAAPFASPCRAEAGLEQAVQAQREVADADGGRVVNGVGDRRGRAHDADLADALGAHRVEVGVVLLEPGRLELLDVRAGGDVVLGEVVVEVAAKLAVEDSPLVQGHGQAHVHPADELRAGGQRV